MSFFNSLLAVVIFSSISNFAHADDDIDVCKKACETGTGCVQFNNGAYQYTEPLRTLYIAATRPDGKSDSYCHRTTTKFNGGLTNAGKICYSVLDLGQQVGSYEFRLIGRLTANLSKTDEKQIKILFTSATALTMYKYDPKRQPLEGGEVLYLSLTQDQASHRDIIFWETSDGRCSSAFLKRSTQE